MFRTLCVILVTTLFVIPAVAQGQKGAIAGSATDETGAVLKGAQILIESQNLNVVSNELGLFFINGLAH